MRSYENFTECYRDLIRIVYDEPHHVCRPGEGRPKGRGGGQEIRERLGQGFILQNPRARLPFVAERDLSASYAVAELLWYLSGSDSTEWIGYYAPFWRNISDDGETANSAYGARVFRARHPRVHGVDVVHRESQWDRIKRELKDDRDSRRAVIHIRTAADSWLADKDVPCTLSLQFFIRDDQLHAVVSMRSSDLILGIPYDVVAFTLFQELMALELGVQLGKYVHVSNSMHLYERDFGMVEKIISAAGVAVDASIASMPPLPSLPPLVLLGAVETQLRLAKTTAEISTALAEVEKVNMDPYWVDWIRVLASNRAGKLGDKQQQTNLLSSTAWSGWSQFRR